MYFVRPVQKFIISSIFIQIVKTLALPSYEYTECERRAGGSEWSVSCCRANLHRPQHPPSHTRYWG